MKNTLLMLSAVLAAGSARADVDVMWAGFLENTAGPVDGTITAIFTFTDAAGTVLGTQTESALEVTDGELVVDLLVPERDDLQLAVVINGDDLGTSALSTAHPAAALGLTATTADRALSASAVGNVTQPVTAAALAATGGPRIPFANVVGFPAAFLDGDQGLVFDAGSTITFSGGVVGVRAASLTNSLISGQVASADLAAGAIATADLANGGVTASDLSNLPVTAIIGRSLRARHFGATAGPTLRLVTETGCSEGINTVTESADCTFTNVGECVASFIGGNPVLGKRPCAAVLATNPNACFITSTSNCPNPLLGNLVFP